MGLFDFFMSEEKKIQKNQRTLTNRDAQAEDREAAAHWLSENGSPKALMSLLTRFDMKLEHQLNDRAEREMVYGLLSQHNDALHRPLEAWLKKCKQFPLPLKLYEESKGEEAAIQMVFDLLALEVELDNFKPAKKRQLLIWLSDRRHDGIIEAATPLTKDFDEGVRYAAIEAMIVQQSDAAREPLIATLMNPNEDSNRLKIRIAEILSARRWSVDEVDNLAENLPAGFAVQDGRVVKA